MKLIFLGPPGAGKGTLAAKGVEICKVPHISTGAIFRSAIAAMSPLGRQVKAIIEGGKLVDDATTILLVKERLAQADTQGGYILDGFPRTIFQAEALAQFSSVDKVVNFDIPDAVVLERLSGRRVCRSCGTNFHITFHKPKQEQRCDTCGGELFIREDDQEEAIRKRLEVYREQTLPLIQYYREQGLLVDIDARGAVDTVVVNFKQALGIG
ncbi:MAG: adenylate kinase [Spirochaetaceae bacterium]|jgi:adenylate kinase|nr:adenylate kinase [Spirochaetaceae bacterium]